MRPQAPGETSRVSESTRQLVLETARQIGYRPNRSARMIRRSKSGIIGMINSMPSHQTGLARIFYASEAIYNSGYELLSSDILWRENGFKQSVEMMLENRVEGIVVAGVYSDEFAGVVAELDKVGVPAVSLGMKVEGMSCVTSDFRQGFRLMTEHLLEGDRRRLVMVMVADNRELSVTWRIGERAKGFEEAMEAAPAGCNWQVLSVQNDEGRGRGRYFMAGRQAMLKILEMRPLPDAVLFQNDDLALSALSVCLERGIRVPEDIAITGCDNTDKGAYLWPPLTTLNERSQDLAQTAVKLLIERITSSAAVLPKVQMLQPCEVIIRQSSTGCIAGGSLSAEDKRNAADKTGCLSEVLSSPHNTFDSPDIP